MTSAVAIFSPKLQLPNFTANTPIYVNEGDGITGWTTTNGTISNPSASVLRLTKTTASGAGAASITRSITLPTGKDYIMYGRTKANRATGDSCTFRIREGAANFQIQFNYNSVTGLAQLDCVSITGTLNVNTYQNAVVVTNWDSEADYYEWALAFDSKSLLLWMYLKQSDGSWNLLQRASCKSLGALSTLGILIDTASAAGSWAEFDFIEVTKPNLIGVGDSIMKGANGFTNGLIAGYPNTWMRTGKVYSGRRNNIIMNRGQNGDTSALVLARLNTDVITNGPKVVFLGCCNNDFPAVSQATRTSNIQSSMNLLLAAGIKVVLIGALRRTQAASVNPAYGAYYDLWWSQYRGTVTGVNIAINVAESVADASGYTNPAYADGDEIHLIPAGAARYGRAVARLPYA